MSVCEESHISLHQVPDNLIRLLRRHAEERPDQPAFIHLLDGQSNQAVLTYAQLDQRARAIAARLQNMGFAAQRVLLVYPPGLDFITTFFGCLYAGCVAVPTYPPHRHRILDRFHAIAADAGVRIALSTSSAATQFQGLIGPKSGKAASSSQILWLATDEISDDLAEQWSEPAITSDTLAMLQYTSGSTSQPKGVMLSHANLIDNTHTIYHAFGVRSEDSAVFWLPTYHDMGLVGGVLVPVFAGATNVLISPADFLQKPITWLAAISKYRATISGGPNFAYDLCVRNITDEQRATLDLSSWALAFIGAEPIQPATLERFAAAFAPCGFKPSAFYPCYGLAEATLMVSGARRGSGATVQAFHETALTENRVEPVPDGNGQARRLVVCGSPVGTMRVVIVNSKTHTEVAPGCVGEIWVAGASVGQGYWHNPRLTSRSFNAHLSNTGEGPFLRTGDLGFMSDGQLYITGRREDLIIVRGLNRYPQDIEATACMSHPLLEAGYGAAFAVDDHGSQRLILVQEAKRNGQMDFKLVLDAVRMAVLDEHDLALDKIVLVRSGTIPKTSSGKVQRRACRMAFLNGKLKSLAEYSGLMVENADPSDTISPGIKGTDSSIPHPALHSSQSSAFAAVCRHAHALAGAAMPDLTPNTPMIALGLDSLQRLELVAAIEKTFGGYMPDAAYCQAQTLGELAQAVQKHLIDGPKLDVPSGEILPERYDLAKFPEYAQLKRHEQMLLAVTGDNPYFRVDQGGAGGAACIDGRQLINFCVYDYVGMSHDPEVAAAAKSAIDRYGTGAGASRLISGEKQVHRDLEQALAAFLNVPATIVFVSGHATNVTTIGHLLGPEDLILHDTLAHNSIIQGAVLSGAARRAFAHNDWMAMDAVLSECRHRYRRVLIAIEGVYSMDGDFPELPRFIELKKKHKTLILVDEAHSLGTMGPTGRGIGEYWGVARADVDIWMGTLSKSLASCGGYIAGSVELVEYLKYTAPGFVYSVGISPPNAAAALASLMVLQRQPQRVDLLHELSTLFLKLAGQRGLGTGLAAGTPVIPVIVGSSAKSLRLSKALFQRGINVQPIMYPVVPEHSARLRFFITTNHTRAQIQTTVSAIADELKALDQHSGLTGD
ncbi:MAG TPA: aminotransferase class I/II-fold pyridoxal phosphate-dependent enzyme [Sedimentisphaerales bacterium]|nr:aminotransferase class I/II-fold pyridoxal phosphate-dependent enzyme [Sedimentisphaerales bacterium]